MESVLKGLGIGLVVLSCIVAQPTEAKSASKLTLTETTLNAPFNLTHPIVSADLLSASGKELVAFGVDDLSHRWMAIYALDDNQYKMALKLELPLDLHSFDITEYHAGQRQKMYFLSQQQLHLFQPQKTELQPN